MRPILYVVIPCYNEEQVLPITKDMFLDKLKDMISKGKIDASSRIMFVNDGSKDATWDLICELSKEDEHFVGISQSRNRGHQNAVLAGLMEAKDLCDITISIDADGQDDIDTMEAMVDEYLAGSEIVYGVRNNRETDGFFKRTTALGFYKVMKLMGVESVYNHADYRLVSSRVLQEFKNYKEVNIFLRGMFPLVGFKSTSVYYKREKRIAGESKYPLRKMIRLAWDGITSLSVRPIKVITVFGFIVALLSFIMIIKTIIDKAMGNAVAGWSSTVAIICFVSGVQIISIGIIGEYIGKIYMEAKARPRYIISDRTYEKKEEKKTFNFEDKQF